jgi:hypothetical protein
MFTEETVEKMLIDTISKNGLTYIPADDMPRPRRGREDTR